MKIVLFTGFQNLKRFQHGVEKTEVNPGADVTPPPWPILDGTTELITDWALWDGSRGYNILIFKKLRRLINIYYKKKNHENYHFLPDVYVHTSNAGI